MISHNVKLMLDLVDDPQPSDCINKKKKKNFNRKYHFHQEKLVPDLVEEPEPGGDDDAVGPPQLLCEQQDTARHGQHDQHEAGHHQHHTRLTLRVRPRPGRRRRWRRRGGGKGGREAAGGVTEVQLLLSGVAEEGDESDVDGQETETG